MDMGWKTSPSRLSLRKLNSKQEAWRDHFPSYLLGTMSGRGMS